MEKKHDEKQKWKPIDHAGSGTVPQYFGTYPQPLEVEQNQNRETSLLRREPY